MGLLIEGQIINETYEVERFLGEGAFAEVYRVKHRFLGRQAMKVFKVLGMNIEEIERCLEEAILLSRIGHPNIIRLFDANVTETSEGIRGFFTMEYVAGGNLDQFWRSYKNSFIPIDTAVEIVTQVCRGMSVAHLEDPPLVHRDIKPQNILIGYDSSGLRVRVSDFGLAKRVNPVTMMASTKGALLFKPPEVFKDPQSYSCSADVWAIGCIFYLLLTLQMPFKEMGDLDLFSMNAFRRPVIKPSKINSEVNDFSDFIVLKCLALDPGDRYENAREILEDISKWKQQQQEFALHDKYSREIECTTNKNEAIVDESSVISMVTKALELGTEAGKLIEAADLMEEAFRYCPELREKYERQVRLWRKGISM